MPAPLYVDVREKDEFERSHIPGAINLPLSGFSNHKFAVGRLAEISNVIIFCQSGARAQQAFDQITSSDSALAKRLRVWEGGMNNWQGEVSEASSGTTISIMRQVLMTAGLMILAFGLLGMFVNSSFYYGVLFVGLGLTFAGVSGLCPMAIVLGKMPWNRPSCCS